MRTKILGVILGVGMLAAAVPVMGHHAFSAEFDANKPIKLEGTVTKMEWINPHAWIHMDVKQPDGKVVSWMIEGGTPNTLFRTGVNRDSLKVGTQIVVRGYQSKDALCDVDRKTRKRTCKANGRDVTLPNGCKLFIGSSGTGAPVDGADTADVCRAPT
jgi:hypothetical protein